MKLYQLLIVLLGEASSRRDIADKYRPTAQGRKWHHAPVDVPRVEAEKRGDIAAAAGGAEAAAGAVSEARKRPLETTGDPLAATCHRPRRTPSG
eukprot:CAMPEP_0204171624 /NCGR_PEP_ID=MMETSP0361-20130328/43416_1 /ASSEMBLY_ACC=CAM_ASM_000343 /TAXON_ID=268821 /ORGANISM="Scrippsiella Hangoei, Strain SHTV-5" /LENGTH=93 /DNA_ID=CAMNT_0051129579 /DNA_START=26 /DNA_END=303 /DNA_ORIENTATION=-